MANSANITAYADDATTLMTFRPVMRTEGVQEYREVNVSKSQNALARKRLSVVVQKNQSQRRQKQTVLPVMETAGALGTFSGYLAPPKVAHEVVVQTTIIASPRATAQDIANALKLHESSLLTDTGAAGTANTYRDLANQTGDVLINGLMPA